MKKQLITASILGLVLIFLMGGVIEKKLYPFNDYAVKSKSTFQNHLRTKMKLVITSLDNSKLVNHEAALKLSNFL